MAGLVRRLWAAGRMPIRDGLYLADDTARELLCDGPGAYHPDAGQPIPCRLGAPFDVARALAEDGTEEPDPYFESPLPDGSGWMTGGGGGMGNVGHFALLGTDRSLRWVAVSFHSNPFTGVRWEDGHTILTNDWGNRLRLDLAGPAFRPESG